MKVSSEGFFLLNFAMDFLVLTLASRGICFPIWPRIVASSLIGAGYALADGCLLFPWWADMLCLAAVFFTAFPLRRIAVFPRMALSAANAAVLIAAGMRLLRHMGGGWPAVFSVGIVLGGTAATVSTWAMRRFPLKIWMRVRFCGRKRRFQALVDTGNLLTEPISALPVLIADEAALGGQTHVLNGVRNVSYGGVGANGSIRCVRPDKMELFNGRKWVCAPEMWLGILPGRMNGGIHALAPGAVLSELPGK